MTDPGQHPNRACKDAAVDVFFPDPGDISGGRQVVRTYCARCPVARMCLEYALEKEAGAGHSGRSGIYGGLSPRQRADLARRRRKDAAA